MFIRKKEYERLCNYNKALEKELYDAKRKLSGQKHECDALCEGCEHLIETKELYCSEYNLVGGRKVTTKRCALDRECKDYKKKGECNA